MASSIGTTAAVRERPILMSGPMVKAILAGRKSQTRRVVKPQPEPDFKVTKEDGGGNWIFWSGSDRPGLDEFTKRAYPNGEGFACPYGKPGDRLWVREAFRAIEDPGADRCDIRRKYRDDDGETHYIVVDYRVDAPTRIMDKIDKPEWKPSIHMPRWASRITLEITGVKVERVQEISEADAKAEGLLEWTDPPRVPTKHYGIGIPDVWETDPRRAFARIWDEINGKRPGCSWADSPWCWCISFRKVEP